MTDAEIENILHRALATRQGCVVETTNPDLLRRRLYAVRAAARKKGNPSFDCLSFRTSPDKPQSEVWIVKSENSSG